jgi:hypothetical protein
VNFIGLIYADDGVQQMMHHIFFWVFGLAHSLSWDYLPGVPQGEEAERRVSWKQKPIGAFFAKTLMGYKPRPSESTESLETIAVQVGEQKAELDAAEKGTVVQGDSDNALARRTSQSSLASARSRRSETDTLSPAFQDDGVPRAVSTEVEEAPVNPPTPPQPSSIVRFFRAISAIVTPITLTIAVALPIALVQPLKSLFVDTTSLGGPAWMGPDGKPPLAFILDTCSYHPLYNLELSLMLTVYLKLNSSAMSLYQWH